MTTKQNIKCFIYYGLKDNEIKLAEFWNPSQKDFLMHEANSVIKKIGRKPTAMLESVPSTNGVWYYKTDKDSIELLLTAKDTSQAMINMFIAKIVAMANKTNFSDTQSINKLKYNVNDSIKLFNSNNINKLQQLNENVEELHGMMKNNVGKLVNNMGDLEIVERKSSVMSDLSMALENDSKLLEKKMKRRQFWIRVVCLVLVLCFVALVLYFIFG